MKVSLATLALLLTVAALHTEADREPANDPVICCFAHISLKIPFKHVQAYYRTSDACHLPAVIFQTKKGWLFCANPSEDWVQEYIRDLDSRSK
ncbi:regakine-1-like [Trichechus manatus latirostris]|uniref:C-C motif chemokine n=1 Tax=Trichechus manatus latirostris TaxID=127582 RepID=A0A2Y9FZX1_TRIMA|nr:regakine-1-like [Trichechus manatus latirostris]